MPRTETPLSPGYPGSGVSMRTLSLTPENVLIALKEAGKE